MSDGHFRWYYWQIRTLLDEKADLLHMDHPAYEICEDYEVEYTGTFRATIVFRDGSQLIVRFALGSDDDIEEYDYVYQYLDRQGKRLFQYDDAPHHPGLSTFPHHWHRGPEPSGRKRDRAHALDINRVDFVAVFAKIEQQYLRA